MTPTSGPTDVVASGTVTSFRGEPISITVEGDEEQITLVFAFVDDPDEEAPRVDSEVVDDQTLRLDLVNFANPLGSGSPEPVEVGTLDGDPLLVHFRVRGPEGADPTLTYSVYRRTG